MHNPKDIVYGRLPRFRLSSRGQEQAQLTARFLSSRRVAALYTSPLLRARQTASILAAYQPHVQPRSNRALIEVGTGYQGSPNSILKPGFSFYEPRLHPDDETMAQVCDRMLLFLRMAARRHAGQTVVAVSHADPITIMRMGLEQRDLSVANLHTTVYPARASVTQITLHPEHGMALSYFDVVGEGPG